MKLSFLTFPQLILVLSANAQSVPAAFTQEELRDRASTYVDLIERKIPATLETGVKMAEFYGYVAGHMDSLIGNKKAEPQLIECMKTKSMREIALRAGIVIKTSKLNRTEPVQFSVTFAIFTACADPMWTANVPSK